MKLDKLGNYIRQVDVRNSDLKYSNVKGISTQKVFIETKANMEGISLHNYKIVKYGQFAYVQDTSRRGDKMALALNREKNTTYLISSIYTVFETNELLMPEFLYLFFNRPEFDRYTRFHSWGSARETFGWEDMCEILIPIISLDEQQQIVSLYNALLKNQTAYQNSLEDLQLICDSYIENLIKTEPKKRLGEYIEQVDNRNTDLKCSVVKGVSIHKVFIETKANMDGVNLNDYKIVKKGEFAFNPNTARMGEKICIALNNEAEYLVSKIYPVFKINATDKLLPEFLYLWFSRPEFDRYARFHSWGSARETFGWEDMCDVMLPIPSIEKQQAIVTIYHTLETRKKLNEKLKESLQPLCPILMKGVREKK